MYDYHHSTLPNALSNIFQSNIDIHNHYTRQYTHHHIQSHRTALSKRRGSEKKAYLGEMKAWLGSIVDICTIMCAYNMCYSGKLS